MVYSVDKQFRFEQACRSRQSAGDKYRPMIPLRKVLFCIVCQWIVFPSVLLPVNVVDDEQPVLVRWQRQPGKDSLHYDIRINLFSLTALLDICRELVLGKLGGNSHK